jgi:cysteinyl-tRNA synthetase
VLCLGLILDPDGQKMSKSRGNVVAPWDVLDTHGADALRWYYFTSQQPWSGYRFSVEAVGESVRKFLLTLWNTYSFYVLYANVDGFEHAGATLDPAASRRSTAGCSRLGDDRGGAEVSTPTTRRRRAARSRRSWTISRTGTCAQPSALLAR